MSFNVIKNYYQMGLYDNSDVGDFVKYDWYKGAISRNYWRRIRNLITPIEVYFFVKKWP
ncbi:Phage uncharacterised protein (Phage_XkdX) [Halobacillus dabanensis]|uniref:Phage uncharacterized protein (Phage_XkdX) n=1 Tax=Halobacillus dabanensis TaxID=240302 RepID=A0A1I3ZYR9_HALDA|nr:Phage uncharacterised protein (Phage_XkdX) [Halobacillus dabanensis]